jgi:hypothetical protein
VSRPTLSPETFLSRTSLYPRALSRDRRRFVSGTTDRVGPGNALLSWKTSATAETEQPSSSRVNRPILSKQTPAPWESATDGLTIFSPVAARPTRPDERHYPAERDQPSLQSDGGQNTVPAPSHGHRFMIEQPKSKQSAGAPTKPMGSNQNGPQK